MACQDPDVCANVIVTRYLSVVPLVNPKKISVLEILFIKLAQRYSNTSKYTRRKLYLLNRSVIPAITKWF